MKILCSALFMALLASCSKQKIYVPQADISLETQVSDYSSIAMLYKQVNDSVFIDVKDAGTITQTHWLFEVDKRLPLKLVIPEVKNLQQKKYKKAEDKMMPNYYTYMDTIAKTVAFMPMDKVFYETDKPHDLLNLDALLVTVQANGDAFINNEKIDLVTINEWLKAQFPETPVVLALAFNEELSFEKYMQAKLNLAKITLPQVRVLTTEVIFKKTSLN